MLSTALLIPILSLGGLFELSTGCHYKTILVKNATWCCGTGGGQRDEVTHSWWGGTIEHVHYERKPNPGKINITNTLRLSNKSTQLSVLKLLLWPYFMVLVKLRLVVVNECEYEAHGSCR